MRALCGCCPLCGAAFVEERRACCCRGRPRLPRPRCLAEFAALTALKRIAEPAETKGLALLLASPASSYLTGVTISIDGGATAR